MLLITACTKEYYFDSPSGSFTLGSTSKDSCVGVTVSGTYKVGYALVDTNTISFPVVVSETGSYSITVNSQNGISFSGSGIFDSVGVQKIILKGSGTPLEADTSNYTITVGSNHCSFSLIVQATAPAVYTLGSGSDLCTGASTAGTFTTGTSLTDTNTVTITVNVASIGTYYISTPSVNGISFSSRGVFTTTGQQSVTLAGVGTPIAAGVKSYVINPDSSNHCTFEIDALAPPPPAAYTLGGAPDSCTGFTASGAYSVGTPLSSSNTILLTVNVDTVGKYFISTTSVNGISFSKTGSFTSIGIQPLTLVGSGTPTAGGTFSYSVKGTGGNPPCTFNITSKAPITGLGLYSCKIDGVLMTFEDRAKAANAAGTGFISDGYGAPPDGNNDIPELTLSIIPISGSGVSNGSYNVSGITSYFMAVNYVDSSFSLWNNGSSIPGSTSPPFTIVITSVTGTEIKGTFSGTIKNGSNQTKSITAGQFDLPIQ
ncbi:MAG: hypothetical protein WDM71_07415 [Ferruginibacter sp.]